MSASEPPVAAAVASPAKYRVALVDDEPNILTALRRELREQPFDLTLFEDSVQAQEALTKDAYALVISDNLMPRLTGLELLASVKNAQPRTRRILLTGRTDLNQAVDAFNAGAIHHFLHKPWQKAELIGTIRKELDLYDAGMREAANRAQLEQQAKLRGERLIAAMKELKQTQTQLVLLEDSADMEALKAGQSLRGLSFLIVDEHEQVRNLLLAALNGAGIAKCHGEPNATAALEYLRKSERVDVILAEWSMQGTDGLAFFRQVRESGTQSSQALFILMAAHEQREVVDFAKKSGINDYLIKPFRLAALFGSVEKLMPQIGTRQAEVVRELTEATVLIVNSHPAARDQIEQLLIQAGVHDVHSVTFGPAGLALLREKKPGLVIYDTNVKDPDWVALRELLTQDPEAPVLVITGVFATQDDWTRMRDLGVSNFLPGPFRQEDLIQAITNVWKLPRV